jgi:large subunit ribosomal protein L6
MLKMKSKNHVEEIELIENVSVAINGRSFTVTGPKGNVSRELYSPVINTVASKNKVTFKIPVYTMREKKLIGTFKAHLKNMAKGVTEGHLYKLKICSGHFPMNVSYGNGVFSVKNFIGEKVPRTLKIDKKVSVVVEGDGIVLEGIEKELVSQTAASIEKLTKRPAFDRRVFQDGIYITEKDGKTIK